MAYQFLNVEFQLFCLAFLAVLAVYHLRLEQRSVLKGMYGMTAMVAVSDILSSLLLGREGMFFSCLAMKTVRVCCFTFIGLLWLDDYISQNPSEGYQSRWFKGFRLLPALTMVALAVVSLETGWIYRADEQMQLVRGEHFYLVLLPLIYVLWVAGLALADRRKAKTEQQRNSFLVPVVLAVFVILISVAEVFVLREGLSLMTGVILLSMFLLFARRQDRQIRVDNLTQLLNRYGMDDEIQEQLDQYKKDHNDSFYVIMCDLDNFKHINDTWGHLEGDRALVLISETLTRVAEQFDVEAFRMGGDEFVLIADTSDETLIKELCETLKTELDAIDFRDDFDIRMSVGAAKYDGKTSVEELLNRADMLLYEAKRETKRS
ncbi:MAG: GGDEF domain-containing protein [Clostridia bacterium]|nr:GGDEF domain-containing protein [Clostridia bacterium]